MRKADYAALADILARVRADARITLQHARLDDAQTIHVATARHQAARDVAHDFARVAAVDRAAFLKACGIE